MKLYLHKQAKNSVWSSPGLWFADSCSRTTFRDWLLGVLSAWREVTSLVLCIPKHLKSSPLPIIPGRPPARLSQVQAGSSSDLDMTLFLIRLLERSRLVGAEGRRMRRSLASLCWEHVSPLLLAWIFRQTGRVGQCHTVPWDSNLQPEHGRRVPGSLSLSVLLT